MNEIEGRRFRTWDQSSTTTSDRQWVLIVKYSLLRFTRSRIAWFLGVASLVILAPLVVSLEFFTGGEPLYWTVSNFAFTGMFFAMVSVACIVIMGSFNFADDIRFNSLLFYFSRPLRGKDYLVGKLLALATISAVFFVVLFFLMVLLLVNGELAQEESWDVFVTSTGQALTLAMFSLLSFVSLNLFALGTISLISLHTRRGWHALLAWVTIVVGWSAALLAAFDVDLEKTSNGLLTPVGWTIILTDLPVQQVDEYGSLGTLPVAMIGAIVIPAIIGVVCLYFCSRRLKHMEGIV